MFQSIHDGESGFYVWDGVSFSDGVPDVDTFIRVAPEFILIEATWTHEGYIGFNMTGDQSRSTRRIALWDVETQSIVR